MGNGKELDFINFDFSLLKILPKSKRLSALFDLKSSKFLFLEEYSSYISTENITRSILKNIEALEVMLFRLRSKLNLLSCEDKAFISSIRYSDIKFLVRKNSAIISCYKYIEECIFNSRDLISKFSTLDNFLYDFSSAKKEDLVKIFINLEDIINNIPNFIFKYYNDVSSEYGQSGLLKAKPMMLKAIEFSDSDIFLQKIYPSRSVSPDQKKSTHGIILPKRRVGFEKSKIYYKEIFYNSKNISDYFSDSFVSTSFMSKEQRLVLKLISPKDIFVNNHEFLHTIKKSKIKVFFNNKNYNNIDEYSVMINKIMYLNSRKEIKIMDYIRYYCIDIIINIIMEKDSE